MYFGSDFDRVLTHLLILAGIGAAALVAAGGWSVYFLVQHLSWH